MNAFNFKSSRSQWPAALLLAAALIVTAFCYYPGLGGTLHFDDTHNLGGLQDVADAKSAISFISQGTAGPSGRPIALATFAPQAYAWPVSPETFLYVNILIHLLNGALVAWVLYLVAHVRGTSARDAAWVASLSAAIWMLFPILASASLLIVQRMTTLSATFMLFGLVGYLSARTRLDVRPVLALGLMSASLTAGTLFAVLTKENGALLPLFVLVIESTLLPRPTKLSSRWWITWRSIFLCLPAVALAAYLLSRLDYSDTVQLARKFSAPERLLTEAYILWEYLYRALLPTTSSLGPFHDDHSLRGQWFSAPSLIVVGSWLFAAITAVVSRRRAPLFAFALGWFVVGHALESTTIPLELYFEHRNYVPLVGPAFALTALLSNIHSAQKLIRAGLLGYAAVLAVVLHSTTSLWGQPALAAEMWAIHKPDSQRATQYLAQQYEAAGDPATARRVLRRYLERNPDTAVVALQVLALSCTVEPEADHRDLLEQARKELTTTMFQTGIFEALRSLYQMATADTCESIQRRTVYHLASVAASNPAFQAIPVAYHNLHVLMSEQATYERDLDLAMHHIESALSALYLMPTVAQAVRTLSSAGLYSAAKEFLDQAEKRAPMHPVRAAIWKEEVNNLKAALERSIS